MSIVEMGTKSEPEAATGVDAVVGRDCCIIGSDRIGGRGASSFGSGTMLISSSEMDDESGLEDETDDETGERSVEEGDVLSG